MPMCRICVGISGSGKSTYAQQIRKNGFHEINRDTVRFDLFCDGVEDWGLYKFTKEREKKVTEECLEDWMFAVANNLNVVVSNTNLNQKDHDYWSSLASIAGYEFEVVYFPISIEEAFKRDLRRGGKAVGRDVLLKQYQQWMKLTGVRTYVPNLCLPETIVADIDGTVAEMSGRSPYEWSRVGEDKPRRKIIELVESLWTMGEYQLVFVSGRDGSCYPETYAWLIKNINVPFKLYMRKTGDQRKDTIIKEEILFNNLEPNYNIQYWFDDRSCVVRNLKLLGVNVIDVSSGLIEF